jgi:polysaccharide export outer membrane protein
MLLRGAGELRGMQGLRAQLLGLLVAALLLGGCGAGGSLFDPSATAAAPPSLAAAAPAKDMAFAPGDKIRITVFGEDKLSGEYPVDNAGFVSMPLIGSIQAAGLTKPELEQSLAKQLQSKYLRNPRVTVESVNFRPFYVLGEVQRPGEYPYRSGLNVLSAIAIAGGATYRASTSKVMIQRSGTPELVEHPQSPNIQILPGDVVQVPERFF